jgi:hypothetical protein
VSNAVAAVHFETFERRVLLSGLTELAAMSSPWQAIAVPSSGANATAARPIQAAADPDLWYLSRQFPREQLGKLDRALAPLQTLLSREMQNGNAKLADLREQRINGTRYGDLYIAEPGRAHVEIYLDSVARRIDLLKKIGMEVTQSYAQGIWQIVGGYLPITSLPAAANVAGVKSIMPTQVTMTDREPTDSAGGPDAQGTVTNEWEALTRADVWTAIRGADNGTEINVGVISDTLNRVGTGLAGSVAAGNLPNGVTNLEDAASGVDEGRAMLELIHDVAPGAALFFHSAFGVSGHAAAFGRLRDAGVDIIADDIPNFREPAFQQGPISQATEAVNTASDVLSFLSAGNRNNETYAGGWSNADANRFHNFSGGDETINFTLQNNEELRVFLHWNQPWGSASTDIDIVVYNSTLTTQLADSNIDNTPLGLPIGNPLEELSFTNTSGATQSYHLAFRVEDGAANGSGAAGLQLQMYAPNNDDDFTETYVQNQPGINPNRNADNVFVLGAVPWNNPGTIEAFSSRGPITRYFSDAGAVLGSPIVKQHPNFTAADGTATGTPGFGAFFGTSASAPNAAAVGALVMDAIGAGRGDISFSQMFNIFRATAVGTNAGGAWNNTHGLGRIDALGAGFAAKGPTYRDAAVELNQFGDSTLGTQNLFGITDVDGFYFASDVSGGTTITATDITASLDPAIFLYLDGGAAGSYVDFAFDGGVGDDARLSRSLSALTLYRAEVFNQTLNTASSDFTLLIDAPNQFVSNVVLDANGDATLTGQNIQADDADYYRFIAPGTASGTVSFTMTPTTGTFDGVMTVYDAAGNVIIRRNAAAAGGAETAGILNVTPGTEYVIRVAASNYATTGNFDLSADFSTILPATLTAAQAESFLGLKFTGVGFNSEFFNDLNMNSAGDVDSYVFAGHTGGSGTYSITVSQAAGSAVAPILAVYDGETGALIEYVSNPLGLSSRTLSFTGTSFARYVVAVADNNGTDTGNLDISVTTTPPGAFTGDNVLLDLEGAGADSNDSLVLGDTQFYRFTVPANGTGSATVRVTPRTDVTTDVALMIFPAASNDPIGSAYAAGPGIGDVRTVTGLTPGAEYFVSVLGRDYATTGGFRVDVETPLKRGTVSGAKFHDFNANGVRNVGDVGLPGWQIYADLDGDNTYDASLLTRSAEPDSFLASTVLNALYPGVTLSAVGTDLPNANVISLVDVNTSTGTRVFGNADPNFPQVWGAGTDELNAQFDRAVTSVSIDFISDDASDIGRLVAFNAANVAIATYTTAVLGTGVRETMTVTRAQGDIAYVRAYGLDRVANLGLLDNLRFTFGENTAISDASGNYSITSIAGGPSEIREVLQAGWFQSAPAAGEHAIDIVSNGQGFTGRDFGNYQIATITGRKWDDLDADGVIDAGENLLANWRIYLDLDNDDTLDAGEPSVLTNAAGVYQFDVTPGGAYTVREVVQAGWEQTFPLSGEHLVNAESAVTYVNRNFGNRRQLDFGDAPNTYATLFASNGARHWVTNNLFLGATIDNEADGQPSLSALGDDAGGIDDENGVVLLDLLKAGTNVRFRFTNGGTINGLLNGWIDYNRNGTFDAVERIVANQNAAPGNTTIVVPIPANLANGPIYARFRININGLVAPDGLGFEGEVEDYRFNVGQAKGDMNCDGVVNNQDISPFVQALTDLPAYLAAFPGCDPLAGDINNDGLLNNQDIAPFVSLLTGSRPGGLLPVPGDENAPAPIFSDAGLDVEDLEDLVLEPASERLLGAVFA